MTIDLAKFASIQPGSDPSPTLFEVVTKSDSVDFANVCSAIYVGTTGDVAAVAAGNNTAYLHKAVPAGSYIFGRFRRVNNTGTTAADMLAVSS